MTTKGKERTGEEGVIEVPWDFVQENSERPDYIDATIEEVQEWVNGLPMSDEDRQSLMDIIRQERAKVSQPQP